MLTEYLETHCHLCDGPLVDGHCIAYHWDDSIHRDNRKRSKPERRHRRLSRWRFQQTRIGDRVLSVMRRQTRRGVAPA